MPVLLMTTGLHYASVSKYTMTMPRILQLGRILEIATQQRVLLASQVTLLRRQRSAQPRSRASQPALIGLRYCCLQGDLCYRLLSVFDLEVHHIGVIGNICLEVCVHGSDTRRGLDVSSNSAGP
jgi:hypothetical protein